MFSDYHKRTALTLVLLFGVLGMYFLVEKQMSEFEGLKNRAEFVSQAEARLFERAFHNTRALLSKHKIHLIEEEREPVAKGDMWRLRLQTSLDVNIFNFLEAATDASENLVIKRLNLKRKENHVEADLTFKVIRGEMDPF